jgi:predicted small metal-binding protein
MQRLLRCDCGYEVRADGDEELVAGVQRHALEAHAMCLTREDVLRLALRLEPTDRAEAPPHGDTKGATT